MLYRADQLENLLTSSEKNFDDPFVIVPRPTIVNEGSGSIDLRLGSWFASFRGEKNSMLDIFGQGSPSESQMIKYHYVPFGKSFVLHPRSFVLGISLEWIRLMKNMGAYVIGKSSWGRRGLIIATAAGVHPGFTGCLTLELCNSGEIPIALYPGMTICQLFVHSMQEKSDYLDATQFIGKRKPTLGAIEMDEVAKGLALHANQK